MDSIDTAAIETLKHGDTDAFKYLVQKYQQKIFAYCYHLLGQKQDAEDAVQEIFFKAYEKLRSVNRDIPLSAWLYKVSYNYCISLIRHKKLLSFIPFSEAALHAVLVVEDSSLDKELSRQLQASLEKLSLSDRSILYLRILEDKSYEEIGSIFNTKATTIRKRYERARKKLLRHFNSMKGETGYENYAVN